MFFLALEIENCHRSSAGLQIVPYRKHIWLEKTFPHSSNAWTEQCFVFLILHTWHNKFQVQKHCDFSKFTSKTKQKYQTDFLAHQNKNTKSKSVASTYSKRLTKMFLYILSSWEQ